MATRAGEVEPAEQEVKKAGGPADVPVEVRRVQERRGSDVGQ